jgi:hypothetical protein
VEFHILLAFNNNNIKITLMKDYMLQVQTLINQKAIGTPGAKRWYEFWKK